jgi:hypothetical protein
MMKDAGRNMAETRLKHGQIKVKTGLPSFSVAVVLANVLKHGQMAVSRLKQVRNKVIKQNIIIFPICQLATKSPSKNGLPPFGGYDSSPSPRFHSFHCRSSLIYFISQHLNLQVRSLTHLSGDSQP